MKKIEELMKKEDFVKELLNKETNEDVVALFKENGASITEAQVEELAAAINTIVEGESELNENALDKVSGGFGWIGVAIIGGLIAAVGKGVQEGTDYISCEVTGDPFWVHKDKNYCDKYKK